MAEGEAERTITSHGDAADRSIPAPTADAVFAFNRRDKLLQKKVAIANGAICGVDVEGSAALGSDYEKIADLMFLAEVIEQRPSSAVKEGLLVVAQSVKKVKYRVALRRSPGRAGVVAGRQVNAVVHWIFKNSAIQCVAVDPALSMRWKGTN